jgi:hypothetical protein
MITVTLHYRIPAILDVVARTQESEDCLVSRQGRRSRTLRLARPANYHVRLVDPLEDMDVTCKVRFI